MAVSKMAEERAERLLASLLDDDDAERWRQDRRVFIPDENAQILADLGFTIYVVANNVYVVYGPRLLDEGRWPIDLICTHTDPSLPLADRLATYVLLIRADLQGALAAMGVPRGHCPCPSCSPGPLARFFWRPGAGIYTPRLRW